MKKKNHGKWKSNIETSGEENVVEDYEMTTIMKKVCRE